MDKTAPQKPAAEADEPLLPMVSYAQNFEDVILRRALRDVDRGFYVDIGAFHPKVDSVTRWFYGQGWTGVNVEPNPVFFALLQEERPHDFNLPLAVAGQAGKVELHLLDGLSTIVDAVVDRHRDSGRDVGQTATVEATTLGQLLDQYSQGRTVDFLKIDAEGAEERILNSYDFKAHRPRILVIEATLPDSLILSVDGWEPGLLSKGYKFCYFDGINRFYVREEDAWRAKWFEAPPNVFDHFLLDLADARVDLAGAMQREKASLADAGLPGLLAQRDDLAVRLERAAAEVQEGRAQLHEARTSAERTAAAAAAAEARLAAVLDVEMPGLEARVHEAEAKATASAEARDRYAEERDRYIVELSQLCLRFRKLLSERDQAMSDAAETRAERFRSRTLEAQLEQTRALLEERSVALRMIKTSRSWRLMAPYRVIAIRLKLALGLLR